MPNDISTQTSASKHTTIWQSLSSTSSFPRILTLHYPHTLEIHAFYVTHSPVKRATLSIMRMIPRMTNLTSLTLSDHEPYGGKTLQKDQGFLSAFRHCLQQSSVEQLCLCHFIDFPFSVLDNSKNIKKLTLSHCSAKKEPIPKSSHLSLDTLIIHNIHDPALFAWAAGRATNLTSLQLPDVDRGIEWTGFPELLTACSNSLRKLHLGVAADVVTGYYRSTLPDFRDWDHRPERYPFTLSAHTCLKQLSISAFVRVLDECAGPEMLSFYCRPGVPAIVRLAQTAPVVQDFVFRFDWDWEDSDIYCLGLMDWSHLALLHSNSTTSCPRIHLCISSSNEGRPISSQSIIDALLENETLRDYVNRDLVVLKPDLELRRPWGLIDYLNR